jgi:hypothetical protein
MRVNKVVARMQAGEQAYGCNLNFPCRVADMAGLTPMARIPDIASSPMSQYALSCPQLHSPKTLCSMQLNRSSLLR